MISYFTMEPTLFWVGSFLLGLLIGSFLNVVILRLPKRLEYDWRCQCEALLAIDQRSEETSPPTLSSPPSRCPACGHQIRALENIPIASYLLLRGRCRACGIKISVRYPLVELLTGLAFLAVALVLGPGLPALAGMVLTAFLIALAGIDLDHQLLPDNLTLPLLWLGLLMGVFNVFISSQEAIIGACVGYLSLWVVFHAYRLVTGKEGMGHGDFKLLAALGAWMGWQSIFLVVLFSSLLGAVFGSLLMALGLLKQDQPFPFGPFIALAGWLCFAWGDQVITAYLEFSGLA